MKGAADSPTTAAIGDGANDVSMIQEAHVGLGKFVIIFMADDTKNFKFKVLWVKKGDRRLFAQTLLCLGSNTCGALFWFMDIGTTEERSCLSSTFSTKTSPTLHLKFSSSSTAFSRLKCV